MNRFISKSLRAALVALCAAGFAVAAVAQPKSKAVLKEESEPTLVQAQWPTPAGLPQREPASQPKDGWISWMNQFNPSNGVGSNGVLDFIVASRWDVADLAPMAGNQLTRIAFAPHFGECEYTLQIYTGGSWEGLSGDPGTMVLEQAMPGLTIFEINEVELSQPVEIPADAELWIAVRCNTQGGTPAGCDMGPAVEAKGNVMFWQGAWTTLTTLNTNFVYNWAIKGYVVGDLAPAPAAVTGFEVVPDPALGLQATLHWTNPAVDLNGDSLASLTRVVVRRDGQPLAEITEGLVPGQPASYVDQVPTTGVYTYAVYAANEHGNGPVAEMSANVGSDYTVGVTGEATVTACGLTIYDNGGPDGTYSPRCDYTLHLLPGGPNEGVRLDGTYITEHNYDKIFVYDGLEASEATLMATLHGEGTVDGLTSTTGPLTVRFTSDGSGNQAGFALAASCVYVSTSCLPPTHLAAADAGETQVTLGWTSPTGLAWNVEYGPRGFEQGTGSTVVANQNPFILTGLTPGTDYDFYVQALCGDDGQSSWSERGLFATILSCDEGLESLVAIVGTGSSGSYEFPVNNYYGNSYTQQIFTSAELNARGVYAGDIKALAFQYFFATPQTKTNCSIYLGHTDAESFDASTSFLPVDDFTLVYQGDMSFDAMLPDNWNQTILQTPFAYDGGRNLVVAVVNNHGAYLSSQPIFRAHATTATMGLTKGNDNDPFDPATQSYTGTRRRMRSNMRLVACGQQPEFTVVSGLVKGSLYDCALGGVEVRFRGAAGGVAVTDAQGQYSIQLAQGYSYAVTASIDGGSYNDFAAVFEAPAAESAVYDIAMTRPVLGFGPAGGVVV